MSSPVLDVVIVTAPGSRALTEACLESLAAHGDGLLASIRVVDNASDDGIVEALRRRGDPPEVTALRTNTGFAAAANRGIVAGNAPYVLLLNPDTEVRPRALEQLRDALERDPAAAVAGPRLVDPEGRPDHNAKRSFPTPRAALGHFTGRPGGGYGRDDVPELAHASVDAISGSCMLVRRAAMAEVGLLDERYWMYGEDLDWCRRFGQAGWRVLYVGGATVVHLKHGVSGRHRSLRVNWAFHRAMGRFYRKFDAGRSAGLDLAVYAGVLLRFAGSAALSAATRRLRTERRTDS